MRYPKSLKNHGVIGFVAPSFGCNREPYHTAFIHAQQIFQQKGYGLEIGPNCYAGEGIGISNTPEKCGQELVDFYERSSNDSLISCGGGELMCEILDYVDFERIKAASPKWYMGYSDNTNFTFLLTTICDTASIYGPCAPAFGMEPWHPALEDAFSLLKGETNVIQNYDGWEKETLKNEEHPLLPYHITEPFQLQLYPAGSSQHVGKKKIQMEGRLLGGNMDCLVNLLGTCYDTVEAFQEKYKKDGIIWFLESCDLNVMSMRRAMWQMEHAGWFRYTKGFLLGRPACFGQEMMGLDPYRAVYDVIQKYDVPIIMDADIGHLPPMMPIVCGSYARIKAQDNTLQIEYQYQ